MRQFRERNQIGQMPIYDCMVKTPGSQLDRVSRLFGRGPIVVRMLSLSLLCLLTVMSAGQGTQGSSGGSPGAVPAARQASNIAVITISGEIDDTTMRSVSRRLDLAQRAGADAIGIELDTPGGDLWAVLGICDAIKACPIKNTVAWVNPRAYSGGAVIALACHEMVITDGATVGDSLIVNRTFGMINAMDEHDRQKFLSPLIADLVDSARRNGYDEMLVQGIASRGVELWLVENNETHRRLFVKRAEYELMFGERPAASSSPVLPSAPALSEAEKQTTPEVKPPDLSKLSKLLQEGQQGKGARGPSTAQKFRKKPDSEQLSNQIG